MRGVDSHAAETATGAQAATFLAWPMPSIDHAKNDAVTGAIRRPRRAEIYQTNARRPCSSCEILVIDQRLEAGAPSPATTADAPVAAGRARRGATLRDGRRTPLSVLPSTFTDGTDTTTRTACHPRSAHSGIACHPKHRAVRVSGQRIFGRRAVPRRANTCGMQSRAVGAYPQRPLRLDALMPQ